MYIDSVRTNIGMKENYPTLAIFDNFKGQVTNEIASGASSMTQGSRENSSELHRLPATNGHEHEQGC